LAAYDQELGIQSGATFRIGPMLVLHQRLKPNTAMGSNLAILNLSLIQKLN
jgi:hypothetical protein